MAATTGSWDSDCLEIRARRCTAADAGSFTTSPFPTPTIPMGHRDSNCSHYRDDYDYHLNNNSTTKVQLTNDIDLQAQPWSTAWVLGDQDDFVQGSALVWRRRRSGRNLHRVSRVRR